MIEINLPFPDPKLNPNKRLHWAAKLKAKNNQKALAHYTAFPYRNIIELQKTYPLKITFIPKDKRAYDRDNLLAASKSLLDGMASGLGINDRQFAPVTVDIGKPDKSHPRTVVKVTSL